jgi:hypothetical protein
LIIAHQIIVVVLGIIVSLFFLNGDDELLLMPALFAAFASLFLCFLVA